MEDGESGKSSAVIDSLEWFDAWLMNRIDANDEGNNHFNDFNDIDDSLIDEPRLYTALESLPHFVPPILPDVDTTELYPHILTPVFPLKFGIF